MDKPLLHLVFGGTVSDPQGTDFIDPDDLDIIGIFPNNNSATKAWGGAPVRRALMKPMSNT